MILIGLGSNLTTEEYASSLAILKASIKIIAKHNIHIKKQSQFYETEPVPKSDQLWFVNAVISVETKHSAHELLKILHNIEHDMGRTRRERWEARIIDLDLLCYHDEVYPNMEDWKKASEDINPKDVVIPHGRLHERDFVLIPIADISKDWTHPVLKKSVSNMIDEHVSAAIVRVCS